MSGHATGVAVTERAAGRREALLLAGLAAVFVLSGASGLIYQVVWVRMLSLVFGVTAYAISTVLSSFFAGLALGSLLAGRLAPRLRAPLRAYAGTEALVAVCGLLTPVAFALARAVYVAAYQHLPLHGLGALTLVRFLLAFLLLLVPTTLMGATLPLMLQSSLVHAAAAARNLSVLYAANTLGATAGTVLAGFELIGRYGLRASLLVAAAANLAAALGALALGRRAAHAARVARPDPAPVAELQPPWGERAARAAVLVFGLSGAVSLAYEVVWARVLAMFFDATTYGFTAMLTMVLLGIAAGSWLVSPLIVRRWHWPLIFAALEAGVGLLGLVALPLLIHLIPLGTRLGLYHDPGPLGEFSLRFMTFAAFLVVFPPMLLLGATFPIAARVVGSGTRVAERVGGVYAVNVLGGIVGALVAGFVLLPRLGARDTMLLLACTNLALAAVLVWSVAPGRRYGIGAVLAAVTVAMVGVAAAPDLLRGVFQNRFAGQQIMYVNEGLENTVVVAEVPATGERKMYINGQPQASTVDFIANYHKLIGHLAVLLHPQPKRALVIGLGGGATAGAVASHSGVQVDLVELSEAVVGAAPLFASVNGDVLTRPNVRLRVDDGRNFLLLHGGPYDVITADVIRPAHAGASGVYSKEYYALARDALSDDGIMLQWLEQLSEDQYKMLMRSFVETFPYVTLWADGSLVAGSKRPLTLERAALVQRLADPTARASLASIGLNTPDDVLALYTGNRQEALRYLADERRAVTDDHPYVEYQRTLGDRRRPPDLRGFSRDVRQVLSE
jgi:predicted membrane-bound spermidine synthase